MGKNVKYIIIAFLVFSFLLCVMFATCFKSADITAVYTRNNLAWDNTELFENGAVKLELTNGKTTVSLKNDVKGNIGYNIYLYVEKGNSNEALVTAKDMTEINKNEYPDSIKDYDIKCAYQGYLAGNKTKKFTIKAAADADLRLLMIMEDNNSYPKEKKNLPTIANVKFSAEVLLDGQYPRGKKFSFSLKDAQGEVIETVHNNDGYISFSSIALKEKGTHTYYISQNEGKDKKTSYDKSTYKITVVAEGKNAVEVFYEKDGAPKDALPRFSNYKENKAISGVENIVEYPINDKKSNEQPNYLLWSTLAIGVLLIIFYIIAYRKKW